MNKIECPQCEGSESEIIETCGTIEEGRFTEVTECMECNIVYDVVADFVNVEIK